MRSIPSITIYYQILMTFTDADTEVHFEELKRLLDEHTTKFPPDEARDMYAYAQNFAIRKINAGEKRYLENTSIYRKQRWKKNY
jgi:hypothetical protein